MGVYNPVMETGPQPWRQDPKPNSLEHRDVRDDTTGNMTASGHALGGTDAESRGIPAGGMSQVTVQERTGVWAQGLRGWPWSFIPITLHSLGHYNDL